MDNIYEQLKHDHKKVKFLLEELVKLSGKDNDAWKELVGTIRDELVPHLRAEEAVFYNAIRDAGGEGALIGHAFGEHATAEAELRTLQAMKTIDLNWTALATKLKDDVIHHAQEEEDKVFAVARGIFSDEESIQIGKAFKELKPAIKAQSLAGTTIDLIANLLPTKLSAGFVKSMTVHHESHRKVG